MASPDNQCSAIDIEEESERTDAIAKCIIEFLSDILAGKVKLSQFSECCDITLTYALYGKLLDIVKNQPLKLTQTLLTILRFLFPDLVPFLPNRIALLTAIVRRHLDSAYKHGNLQSIYHPIKYIYTAKYDAEWADFKNWGVTKPMLLTGPLIPPVGCKMPLTIKHIIVLCHLRNAYKLCWVKVIPQWLRFFGVLNPKQPVKPADIRRQWNQFCSQAENLEGDSLQQFLDTLYILPQSNFKTVKIIKQEKLNDTDDNLTLLFKNRSKDLSSSPNKDSSPPNKDSSPPNKDSSPPVLSSSLNKDSSPPVLSSSPNKDSSPPNKDSSPTVLSSSPNKDSSACSKETLWTQSLRKEVDELQSLIKSKDKEMLSCLNKLDQLERKVDHLAARLCKTRMMKNHWLMKYRKMAGINLFAENSEFDVNMQYAEKVRECAKYIIRILNLQYSNDNSKFLEKFLDDIFVEQLLECVIAHGLTFELSSDVVLKLLQELVKHSQSKLLINLDCWQDVETNEELNNILSYNHISSPVNGLNTSVQSQVSHTSIFNSIVIDGSDCFSSSYSPQDPFRNFSDLNDSVTHDKCFDLYEETCEISQIDPQILSQATSGNSIQDRNWPPKGLGTETADSLDSSHCISLDSDFFTKMVASKSIQATGSEGVSDISEYTTWDTGKSVEISRDFLQSDFTSNELATNVASSIFSTVDSESYGIGGTGCGLDILTDISNTPPDSILCSPLSDNNHPLSSTFKVITPILSVTSDMNYLSKPCSQTVPTANQKLCLGPEDNYPVEVSSYNSSSNNNRSGDKYFPLPTNMPVLQRYDIDLEMECATSADTPRQIDTCQRLTQLQHLKPPNRNRFISETKQQPIKNCILIEDDVAVVLKDSHVVTDTTIMTSTNNLTFRDSTNYKKRRRGRPKATKKKRKVPKTS